MTEAIRDKISLLRHQIISPVLMESVGAQKTYFKKISTQVFDVPGVGPKYFAVETMRSWLKMYRKFGIEGLKPKKRSDTKIIRSIEKQMGENIQRFREENMEVSTAKFYRKCLELTLLGDPPICEQTLRRFLKANNLFTKDEEAKGRKRYEMNYFGELWVGDFMHGPVLTTPKKKKAILLGIIDDHSRMIVGHKWSFTESTLPIENVFKEAILKYGKPDKLYLDNGPSFSGTYLHKVCAGMGIGLVHSKPYDSPSRGKIERFWRTVRESFLSDFKGQSIEELNKEFDIWLRTSYHFSQHAGIGCRPVDRYELSTFTYPRKSVPEELIEEFFLVKKERKVNKDSTISFENRIYEVPPKYIGKIIEIRFRQEKSSELFLYENNARMCSIKMVDVRQNGKMYKPKDKVDVIPYRKNGCNL